MKKPDLMAALTAYIHPFLASQGQLPNEIQLLTLPWSPLNAKEGPPAHRLLVIVQSAVVVAKILHPD